VSGPTRGKRGSGTERLSSSAGPMPQTGSGISTGTGQASVTMSEAGKLSERATSLISKVARVLSQLGWSLLLIVLGDRTGVVGCLPRVGTRKCVGSEKRPRADLQRGLMNRMSMYCGRGMENAANCQIAINKSMIFHSSVHFTQENGFCRNISPDS
jgi:hypothetical protein